MAHFVVPPNTAAGDYDVDSKVAPGSVWRVKVPLGSNGVKVGLWGGANLDVASNNPGVLKNDPSTNRLPESTSGDLRILTLTGERIGTTLVWAGLNGAFWVGIQVQVVAVGTPVSGTSPITLLQPSMALNATDSPGKYHMSVDRLVPPTTSPDDMFEMVKSAGTSFRHLVISCHGFIDHSSPQGVSRLAIGTDLNKGNAGSFAKLKGVVDVIWIGACVAAGSQDADEACKLRALAANAYVIAPSLAVACPSGTFPLGKIDIVGRSIPKVFTPSGGLLAWSAFLTMGTRLKFTVNNPPSHK